MYDVLKAPRKYNKIKPRTGCFICFLKAFYQQDNNLIMRQKTYSWKSL
jgi:hypothetical protein